MPIRFRCVYCGQLLAIATRKIGSAVDCPKCSHPNVVPEKDQADKEEKKARSADKIGKTFESKKFDQWLGRDAPPDEESDDRIEHVGSGSADIEAAPDLTEARPSGSESESAVEEPWRREPEGLPASRSQESSEVVAIGAGAAVPLAILVVVLLLVAFGLGLLVGRYVWPASDSLAESTASAPVSSSTPKESLLAEATAAHKTAITGRLEYELGEGMGVAPDVGATVIAVRHDATPAEDRRIAADGLRPGDPESPSTMERLTDYGGGFAVVGADGEFRLTALHPGGYLVLILSKNVSGDAPIPEVERQRLAKYFVDTDGLIGDRAFLLRDCAIGEDKSPPSIEYQFPVKK